MEGSLLDNLSTNISHIQPRSSNILDLKGPSFLQLHTLVKLHITQLHLFLTIGSLVKFVERLATKRWIAITRWIFHFKVAIHLLN